MGVSGAGSAGSDLKWKTEIGTRWRLAEWFSKKTKTETLRKRWRYWTCARRRGAFAGCENAVENRQGRAQFRTSFGGDSKTEGGVRVGISVRQIAANGVVQRSSQPWGRANDARERLREGRVESGPAEQRVRVFVAAENRWLRETLARMLANGEQQLIPFIAQGLTNKEIANHSCLSEQTVKNHLYRMKHKVAHKIDCISCSFIVRRGSWFSRRLFYSGSAVWMFPI
jgi:DNA-binding CsgD family transcriptional regulator